MFDFADTFFKVPVTEKVQTEALDDEGFQVEKCGALCNHHFEQFPQADSGPKFAGANRYAALFSPDAIDSKLEAAAKSLDDQFIHLDSAYTEVIAEATELAEGDEGLFEPAGVEVERSPTSDVQPGTVRRIKELGSWSPIPECSKMCHYDFNNVLCHPVGDGRRSDFATYDCQSGSRQ